MRIRSLSKVLPCLSSLFALIALPALAQNRLPQVISSSGARMPVANSVSPKLKAARILEPVNADMVLPSLSLRFNMTDAQSATLDKLLADQQNPRSPRFHQWLTPEQFADQFGIFSSDIASTGAWLQQQGFTAVTPARSRTFITFSGTVGQVNNAFSVSMHAVSLHGEPHIANLSDPVLPAALAKVTREITGLNDLRVRPGVKHRVVSQSSKFTDGNGEHFIAPGDFYTIYDTKPLLNAATPINGSGVTIAVLGQVDISSADVQAFRAASGLSATLPATVVEGADPGAPSAISCNTANPPDSCDDFYESMLDVEWSGAVAPSASILFVTGQDVFNNSMTQAIDGNLAPILTVSYGDCEAGWGNANIASFNALFKQANAQGQTVLGPGADSGAADCDYSTPSNPVTFASNGLAVDFPASSPFVTGVGGTMFDEGGGAYWNASPDANGGTVLSYIPEQPWNDFFITEPTGSIYGLIDGAGGGGVSSVFSKPAWQTGSGVPADASRDVPDLSFNSGAQHDGYLVCVFASCTNGTFGYTSQGNTVYAVFGGTSVATPAFAGILALLEQKVGPRLGNLNPTLYGLANSSFAPSVFHDKSAGGTNAAPCHLGSIDCSPGSPNFYAAGTLPCPASSCSGNIAYPAIGYVAGTGYVYDLATGWGSVNVTNMVNDWLLATPTGTGSVSALNRSTTTVTSSAPSVSSGGSVTISASVAGSGSATPTGTATLLVDNVAAGSAVAIANGSVTFLAYNTANLASGRHTFSVSYSGDATYAGSKSSVNVDVTSASAADFTLTPATATVAVPAGGTAPGVTYTVTPLNGFVGDVNFSAGVPANSTLNATYIFSVTPVVLSGVTAGTTVLTLQAFVVPTAGGKGFKHSLGLTASFAKLWTLGGSGIAWAGLMLISLPRRRRSRFSEVLLALASVSILAVSGCTTGTSRNTNTTPGTYAVTVTAQGTNASGTVLTHNVSLTFVVQ